MTRILTLAALVTLLFSCQSKKETTPETTTPAHWKNIPTEMMAGLDGHGGLEQWNKMKTMEFSYPKREGTELHQVDLPTRKVRITHENYTIGFDGKEAWVTPDKEALGGVSARFYHNLIFYFYAIPYVLADPGTNYEVLPSRTINGKELNAIKVSFNDGVGDAPDDYYIAHFDKKTNEMYLLLYTVTYFSGESNENFGAIVFDDWKEVNGLKIPKTMKGYKYAADTLGEQRYIHEFSDLKLSETALDPSIFERPDNAVIDSLIQR